MITTERRGSGWVAYAFGDREIWEAGRSEAEAVGKLVLRLQAEGHLRISMTGYEPFPKCDDCGEVWVDHVCLP